MAKNGSLKLEKLTFSWTVPIQGKCLSLQFNFRKGFETMHWKLRFPQDGKDHGAYLKLSFAN